MMTDRHTSLLHNEKVNFKNLNPVFILIVVHKAINGHCLLAQLFYKKMEDVCFEGHEIMHYLDYSFGKCFYNGCKI
jgi:hypothetical protein